MDGTLILLKSAQAKHFFQQNITFLAQPEGFESSTRYKAQLAHHAPGAPLPQRVVILFGDPPYETVIPVREALLKECEWDEQDESFIYHLILGPLAAVMPLEFGTASAVNRPHEDAFVFITPALELPTPGAGPEQRWRALVNFLSGDAYSAADNPYAGALFSFVHPLESAGGMPVQDTTALRVGKLYRQRLSILAPGQTAAALEAAQQELHLDYPRLSALVTLSGALREGSLSLEIQPTQPLDSPWTVNLSLRSTTIPSGPVHLRLPPIGRLTTVDNSRSDFDPHERLQLFKWLSTRLNTRDQLRLLERFLLPRADGLAPDPSLLTEQAALFKKEGRLTEAVDTLLRIPPAERDDEATVLLLECAVGARRRLPYTTLLDEVSDWDDGQLVQRLVEAIAQLPEETILPVSRHLCQLAPVYAHLLWQSVAPALKRPTYRLELLRFLHAGSSVPSSGYLKLPPGELYHYLARDVEPRYVSDDYLDFLIDVAMETASPTGIAPLFTEWLGRRLRNADRDDVLLVRARFEKASHWLSTTQVQMATNLLVDALQRSGQTESAIWLACDHADAALRRSDFEGAERWLREARNRISSMPAGSRSEMLNLIKALDENLKQTRHEIATTFAPRYGSDPGLGPIFKLYGIEATDGFWADLADVLSENSHVVTQLIERLEQLQQFAQQSGSANATIHSLTMFGGNVSRMELTDSARLIFRKIGKNIRLVALYANHDAYDEALKQRWELMNRLR